MPLDLNNIPTHVAIILDGNGRWANKRLMPRNLGHRKGAFNLQAVAKHCNNINIKYLTCFCFSTENWSRPKAEVEFIMNAPLKYYQKYKNNLFNSNYKIQILGRRDRLSEKFLNMVNELEENTKNHTGLTLSLCIDYGSHDEITNAVKQINKDVANGKITNADITPDLISSYLYTNKLPAVDLLIRTSGELRISNFLLWQIAYAELYFTSTLWPDFDEKELHKAIIDYQSRNRRYGGLKNDNK